MKTMVSLIAIAIVFGCGPHRGAQPPTANKTDSVEAANAAVASTVRHPDASPNEPTQPQARKVDVWDPNDALHVADRMRERVKQEGVVKIASVRAKGDRYVFVGEFEESWQFAPTGARRRETDLWLVNRNGTRLRRLTNDRHSFAPAWSPTGEEIAFINFASICVIGVESDAAELALPGSLPSVDGGGHYFEYSQPLFSPNGKCIAALAKDGTTSWVKAAVRLSDRWAEICTFAKGFERHEWNSRSELIVDYGRFVLYWERLSSDDDGSSTNSDKANSGRTPGAFEDSFGKYRHEQPQVFAQLLRRLLRRLRAYGVTKIGHYSVVPSGHCIVLAGEFERYLDASERHESDLWLVNRDGSGLLRLTENHRSAQPELSPLENDIAFVDGDSVSVMNVKTRNVRRLPGLQADKTESSGYARPRWSPNGKVIAAVGEDQWGHPWITVVGAESGHEILELPLGIYNFQWNRERELVIGKDAKFVFNWSSALFKKR